MERVKPHSIVYSLTCTALRLASHMKQNANEHKEWHSKYGRRRRCLAMDVCTFADTLDSHLWKMVTSSRHQLHRIYAIAKPLRLRLDFDFTQIWHWRRLSLHPRPCHVPLCSGLDFSDFTERLAFRTFWFLTNETSTTIALFNLYLAHVHAMNNNTRECTVTLLSTKNNFSILADWMYTPFFTIRLAPSYTTCIDVFLTCKHGILRRSWLMAGGK